MKLKPSIILILLLALSACNEFTAPTKKLTVEVESIKNIQKVDKVLMARFQKYPASTFATVDSYIKDKTIIYRFKRGAPKKELLHYLVETKGQLTASIDPLGNNKGELLFSNADIANATPAFSELNGLPVIQLQLSKSAAKEMEKKTARNIGKQATMKLDGEVLTQARIMEPLSQYVEITIDKSTLDIARISALLGTGALPEKVRLISIIEDK